MELELLHAGTRRFVTQPVDRLSQSSEPLSEDGGCTAAARRSDSLQRHLVATTRPLAEQGLRWQRLSADAQWLSSTQPTGLSL